jgi:hypothetical protein
MIATIFGYISTRRYDGSPHEHQKENGRPLI